MFSWLKNTFDTLRKSDWFFVFPVAAVFVAASVFWYARDAGTQDGNSTAFDGRDLLAQVSAQDPSDPGYIQAVTYIARPSSQQRVTVALDCPKNTQCPGLYGVPGLVERSLDIRMTEQAPYAESEPKYSGFFTFSQKMADGADCRAYGRTDGKMFVFTDSNRVSFDGPCLPDSLEGERASQAMTGKEFALPRLWGSFEPENRYKGSFSRVDNTSEGAARSFIERFEKSQLVMRGNKDVLYDVTLSLALKRLSMEPYPAARLFTSGAIPCDVREFTVTIAGKEMNKYCEIVLRVGGSSAIDVTPTVKQDLYRVNFGYALKVKKVEPQIGSCLALAPKNSVPCASAPIPPKSKTPNVVVDSCGADAPACAYSCNYGFRKKGNTCVPFICTNPVDYSNGTDKPVKLPLPKNVEKKPCVGTDQGLAADTPSRVADVCNPNVIGENKCVYQCKPGYETDYSRLLKDRNGNPIPYTCARPPSPGGGASSCRFDWSQGRIVCGQPAGGCPPGQTPQVGASGYAECK